MDEIVGGDADQDGVEEETDGEGALFFIFFSPLNYWINICRLPHWAPRGWPARLAPSPPPPLRCHRVFGAAAVNGSTHGSTVQWSYVMHRLLVSPPPRSLLHSPQKYFYVTYAQVIQDAIECCLPLSKCVAVLCRLWHVVCRTAPPRYCTEVDRPCAQANP